MLILGLDPGITYGWAIIRAQGETIELLDCGQFNARIDKDISAVALYDFLEETDQLAGHWAIAFEDEIWAASVKTNREATQLRGVLRLYCEKECAGRYYAYHPAHVRPRLACQTEKDAHELMFRLFGDGVPKGTKNVHARDAIVVACAHAVQSGAWQMRIPAGTRKEVLEAKPAKIRRNLMRDIKDPALRAVIEKAQKEGKVHWTS